MIWIPSFYHFHFMNEEMQGQKTRPHVLCFQMIHVEGDNLMLLSPGQSGDLPFFIMEQVNFSLKHTQASFYTFQALPAGHMLKFRDSNKRLVVCLIIGAQYGCTAGVRKCCDSSKLVSVHCALRPVFVDAVPIPGTLGVLASCSQPPAVPRLYSYCLVWKVHISCQDIYSSLLIGFL